MSSSFDAHRRFHYHPEHNPIQKKFKLILFTSRLLFTSSPLLSVRNSLHFFDVYMPRTGSSPFVGSFEWDDFNRLFL